jgi:hypothetical protein
MPEVLAFDPFTISRQGNRSRAAAYSPYDDRRLACALRRPSAAPFLACSEEDAETKEARVVQRGQVFRLNSRSNDDQTLWAYRYRSGGRDSKRVQRGGFASEQDARAALERALEKTRRTASVPTLVELVEQYLAQHEVAPITLEKLRWLLTHALAAFGARRINELEPHEIAAWRMTVKPGYRFEATQALRQVLARAVVWGMLDVNPAKQGVENPQRRRTEKATVRIAG